MTRAVTAAERRRDRIALAIVGVGLFAYVASFLGMRTLAEVPIIADPAHPAIVHFTNLWYLSRAGIVIVIVGGAAMAWSFWRYVTRAPETP